MNVLPARLFNKPFKLLSILSIVLFSSPAFSQTPNISIKFCPLALIDDVSFPTIQAGVEIKLSHKMTWYNEIGIKHRKSGYENADTSFVASKGFKLKTELRYYFKTFGGMSFNGLYLAANEFFYEGFA